MPNTAPDTSLVHVAVGVILNEAGDVLISRRAAGAHQGDLWEFPGGKVEEGEDVQQALSRELKEELAIDVGQSEPLLTIEHDYGDKAVLLDVHVVTCFSNTPRAMENQPLCWVKADQLESYAFPAANVPIIAALQTFLSRSTH